MQTASETKQNRGIQKIKAQTECAECFRSLGVPTRNHIYSFLKNKEEGSATVNEVVKHVGLKQPTVSYHLKDMQQSGLLNSVKKGKEVFYSVNPNCPYSDSNCILHRIEF